MLLLSPSFSLSLFFLFFFFHLFLSFLSHSLSQILNYKRNIYGQVLNSEKMNEKCHREFLHCLIKICWRKILNISEMTNLDDCQQNWKAFINFHPINLLRKITYSGCTDYTKKTLKKLKAWKTKNTYYEL